MKVESISRNKKERFLRELSEDDFRDLVVRPLLLRLNYEDGRDLCGPQEQGKDAIFAEKDNLGFTIILALQTKKGNLNLASKATQNIVDAVTQLNTALATTVVLMKDRRKVKPNRAILAASGVINESARRHIVDEVGNPNLQFLDCNDLIPMIDSHLPEFWLKIDADIQPYFRAIEAIVLGKAKPQTVIGGGQDLLDAAATDDSYIDLSFHKTIIRRKKVRGAIEEYPDIVELKLASLVKEKSQRILILGDPGSGKSTCLLRLAYELAREGLAVGGQYRVPILVRALDIYRAHPAELVSFLDEATRSVSGSARACFTMDDLGSGAVIVLIDSLDELSNDDERRYVLEKIEEFSHRYPKTHVIMTSRPYRFVSELKELKPYEEFRVSPISWRQAEKIFNRIQKGKLIPLKKSNEVLRNLEKMHGVDLNPLLVTVFAAATDVSKQDIPANITELFKKFTELMLGRWDERKGIKYQYQAPLKDFVVMRLAFWMHQKRIKNARRDEIENLVNQELRVLGHAPEGQQLLTEILDRSGLFRVVGENIEFRHHLLQEFFAGRAIPNIEFVNEIIKDEWWTRALVFYFGENPSRADILKSAVSQLVSSDGSSLFMAACAVGLSIQACYLSAVTDKLDVWKWVNRSLTIARDKALAESGMENRIPLTLFLAYYIHAKDSVSLANLKPHLRDLVGWCNNDSTITAEERESAMFWLLVGLVEAGDIDAANEVSLSFHPKDPRLAFALHLGCFMADRVRPIDPSQKVHAREISKRLANKILPYRKQLMKEWGSELLELRKGTIATADDDVEQESPVASNLQLEDKRGKH